MPARAEHPVRCQLHGGSTLIASTTEWHISIAEGTSTSGESRSTTRLEDLHEWLSEEQPLRSSVRLAPGRPRPGELGSVLDVLVVGAGAGGVLTTLASGLTTWLQQRRNGRVKITIANGHRKAEIEATNVTTEDVERLLRELRSED